jgi:outer membrane biosynthesis protein TonB
MPAASRRARTGPAHEDTLRVRLGRHSSLLLVPLAGLVLLIVAMGALGSGSKNKASTAPKVPPAPASPLFTPTTPTSNAVPATTPPTHHPQHKAPAPKHHQPAPTHHAARHQASPPPANRHRQPSGTRSHKPTSPSPGSTSSRNAANSAASYHIGDPTGRDGRGSRAGAQRPGSDHIHLLRLGRRAQAQGSKDPGRLGQNQAEVRSPSSCGPAVHASECRHANRTPHSLANQTPRSIGNRLGAAHVRARDAVDRDNADGRDRHSRRGEGAGKRDARSDLRSRPRRRGGRRGISAGALRPGPPAARPAAA